MAPNDIGQAPTDIIATARGLAPLVLAAREEAEQTRRLPPHVADAFAAGGLFQMALPRSMGGLELPPLTAFHVIEEISKADGSAGWCVMVANAIAAFMALMPVEVGRHFAGQPANFRAAGSLRPMGKAFAVEGGYRVKGQWNFASGINHATWLYCSALVMDGDTPRLTPTGAPTVRAMWLPAHVATIVDTWSVVGMRGTGSQDYIVDDVFVPAEHTCSVTDRPLETGHLYHPRITFAASWTGTAANALGNARGAIDAFKYLAASEGTTQSATLLRDRPYIQARLAEAEAILNAARAYVIDSLGTAWQAVCSNAPDLDQPVAQVRLAIAHGMREAVRAVDLVFHAAGTNAIYSRNPLERYFRDAHVAVQHLAALPVHYESAGKALMGLRPTDIGW
ncbi:MAG TPA: hydroxylase [Acetobacteraceae bacterium]|jgi:indole-3-acetate monooxygenase|nr:hydroxylase [Acetobacteraceae bacterium]